MKNLQAESQEKSCMPKVKKCIYHGCDNTVDKEASVGGVPCCYDCRDVEDDYIKGENL